MSESQKLPRPPTASGDYKLSLSSSQVQPKVAIPRVRRKSDAGFGSSVASDKQRVERACTNCRKRKVKCTGEKPRCKHCEGFELECVYVQGRKDRLKNATDHNAVMVRFLRELQNRVSYEDQRRILDILQAADDDRSIAASSTRRGSLKRLRSSDSSKEEHGEAKVSADVGSNESLDLLDEDLNRDEQARATGFVGKNSELQWLRRLRLQLDCDEEDDSMPHMPYGPPGNTDEAAALRIDAGRHRRNSHAPDTIEHISGSTYFLDNDNIEVEFMVDPFEMPTPETAEKLFACYLETVHDSFPILRKKTFVSQFETYFTSVKEGKVARIPPKWRAILNLIFAIGAKYSHLVRAGWAGDERDHAIYYTRARATGLSGDAIVAHPDLQQIQISGLLSFYYLSIGQISRSWIIIGLALRFAYALGLHVRNEDPGLWAISKEIRVRVWWALYSLERLLGIISGRPSAIVDEYCAVPLPLPMDEDQLAEEMGSLQLEEWNKRNAAVLIPALATGGSMPSNISHSRASVHRPGPPKSGSYFRARVQICIIVQKVLNELYSAGTVIKSWENAQSSMMELTKQVDHWATNLPDVLDFNRKDPDSSFKRERMILELFYHSTLIIISRPCLCRLERRIENQTDASATFNKKTAKACINAAMAMTDILPDQPDPITLYKSGPWWCIVHNIMQAMAVFMLEMSYHATHMPESKDDILQHVRKLIRWLRAMGEDNAIAARAYELSIELVQKVAPRVQADITDLLAEDTSVMAEPTEANYGNIFGGQEPQFPLPGQGVSHQEMQQGSQPNFAAGFTPNIHPSFTQQIGPNIDCATTSQRVEQFLPFQQTFFPETQQNGDAYANAFTTFDQHNPFLPADAYHSPDDLSPEFSPHNQNQYNN
ncbi:hypothetical protein K432DRAFT_294972 [Lepidopterella palustris CBS 459.81]|uniref:Zn(2)-C6 fungal-type domain-containing protein n=1 Tax=Lepidopterella palustris CBS 459.81 TaxID=1314670 RepID=A0A8E2EDE2_9PEZI|nr:hypothetical protein K432DRAFT_294972 [Lepidopterella palustris CBS 459.81]